MTRSELIERLAAQQLNLPRKIVEDVVKEVLEHLADTLVSGERIEIRGFGTLSLRHRAPGIGRNPKTGENVKLGSRCVPHFKPGSELRERVNLNPDLNLNHGA